MRGVIRLCAVALSLALGFGSTAAFAASNVDQEGWQTLQLNVDATNVWITPNSFHPVSGQCVIYSDLMPDFTPSSAYVQVEAGVFICNTANLDRTCSSGNGFAEAYDGAFYHCVQGGPFTLGGANLVQVVRTAGTTSVYGATSGAYISQSGFGATDWIEAIAWAEASGGTTCPISPNSAGFTNWQQFTNANGWAYISSSKAVSYTNPVGYGPCFTKSLPSSTGGFNVS
jgi:hypothetical protein